MQTNLRMRLLIFSIIVTVVSLRFSLVLGQVSSLDLKDAFDRTNCIIGNEINYETAIGLARHITNEGRRQRNVAIEARGLARMAFMQLQFGKWGDDWQTWLSRALSLTEDLPAANLARAETLMIDGFLKAKFLDQNAEGIERLNEAVVIGKSIEDDKFLGRVFCLFGEIMNYAGKRVLAAENFERSILFSRNAGDKKQEFQSLTRAYSFEVRRKHPSESKRARMIELGKEIGKENIKITLNAEERYAELVSQVKKYEAELEQDANHNPVAVRQLLIAARRLSDFFIDEQNWKEAERHLLLAERAATVVQDATSLKELVWTKTALLARQEKIPELLDLLQSDLDFWNEAAEGMRHFNAYLQLATLLNQSGNYEMSARMTELASTSELQRLRAESEQISDTAQSYFDDQMKAWQLAASMRKRESALARSVTVNRWILAAIPILGLSIFVWQRDRQHRLAQTRLQEQINQKTASLRKATDEAVRANQAKTRFLARINHELRNPLTAIVGSCEVLDTKDPANAESLAKTIKACTQNLLDVVDEVLDFTKIESGKLELRTHPFSPAELVGTVKEIIQPKIAKAVTLETDLDPGVPTSITADEAKLRQVLVNLGQNAARHTEMGTIKISVTTHKPSHTDGRDGPRLCVSVADSGPGIPEANQSAIFDEYVTGDERPGSGLGLYICTAFVKQMGGNISCTSHPGTGTIFEIEIPFTETLAMPKPVAATPSQQTSLRVLIVDDEKLNRQMIGVMLSSLGCEHVSAENWGEVEEYLRDGVDLVLMDLRMQKMNGFQMMERIQAMKLMRTPKVVAITGDATNETRMQTITAGFSGFVPKPFTLATLASVVQESQESVP